MEQERLVFAKKRCKECGEEKNIEAFGIDKQLLPDGKHPRYADGRRPYCIACRKTRSHRLYVKKKDAESKRMLLQRTRLRMRVLAEYGSVCVCCGEHRFTMLDIDHVYNDGADERRERGTEAILRNIIRTGAWDRYQVLCCNCNQSKRRNRGKCEHGDNGSMADRLAGACFG